MQRPTTQEIVNWIDAILDAVATREQVAAWAAAAIHGEAEGMEFHIWRALVDLSNVARMEADGTYLHHGTDLLLWKSLLTDESQGANPDPDSPNTSLP